MHTNEEGTTSNQEDQMVAVVKCAEYWRADDPASQAGEHVTGALYSVLHIQQSCINWWY
jgi:hypothetical protein